MTGDRNNLGGVSPSNENLSSNSQVLNIQIPEELKGKKLHIITKLSDDKDLKLGASWITGLTVNDATNTVTGSVTENTMLLGRSAVITLTASGNLSTTSPYSFTVKQEGKVVKLTNTITVYWYNKSSNSMLYAEADKPVDSDLTITTRVNWTSSTGGETFNEMKTLNISKGSTLDSIVMIPSNMTIPWNILDGRSAMLPRVSPTSDDKYEYTAIAQER